MSDPLYQVILTSTGQDRWDATELLMERGVDLKDVALALGKHHNWLYKWRTRNRKRYEHKSPISHQQNVYKPSQSHRLPVEKQALAMEPIDGTYRHIDLNTIRRTKYGELPPTYYVSTLDHYDWLVYYGGEHKYRWDLDYLRELQAMLWTGTEEMAFMPRFSGKTVSWEGMTVREIAEIREPYLTICSPKRTKTLFRAVEKWILRNPKFRQDYGDILAVENGNIQSNRTELVMILHESFNYPYMDEVFKVASVQSDIIGRHPHHIHLEDIIQQDTDTEEVIEKMQEWYLEVLRPMLSLEKGINSRITGTATRKGPEDFYSWLFSQGWNSLHYRAVEVLEGELPSHTDVIFEEETNHYGEIIRKAVDIKYKGEYKFLNPHIDQKELLMIAALKYESFMSQYQNEPVSSKGNYFKREWWEAALEEPFDTSRMTKFMIWDTAFGKTSKADYNAGIVCVVYNSAIHIIDIYLERNLKFGELRDKMVLMAKKHKVNKTWLHVFGREDWILQEVRKLIAGVEKYQETTNKIIRIDLLDTPFKLGQIRVFNTCSYLNLAKTQILQYDRRPSTATKKDDFPDVCATAYEKLQYYLSNTRINFISR